MKPNLSRSNYERLSRPRYGVGNPERIDNPLWEAAFRENLSGYGLRKRFGDRRDPLPNHSSRSDYRDGANGPVWCWRRMGATRTELPDGRVVHIGGEHEDWYDPDFCIFNEVVVEHPGGLLDIYGYPRDVFPPTDFHTATLIGDAIIVIGSLGYRDLRRMGETQLFRLDLSSFRMERLETSGAAPGWLCRHEAEALDNGSILVLGGEIHRPEPTEEQPDGAEIVDNDHLCALDPERLVWREIGHGDTSLFPVSAEDYRRSRTPRVGVANPERVESSFWIEAARRNWRPLRSRLHYGERSTPCPRDDDRKLVHGPRPVEQVVWTSQRSGAAEITLTDGRRLTIAGQFSDFGNEWGDRWVYNDVIVRHPDGGIEIFAYPETALPPLISACSVENEGRLLVFGQASRFCAFDRQTIAVEIDEVSMAAILLDTRPNTRAIFSKNGPEAVEDRRIVFACMRTRREDPACFVAFDLEISRWREA